MCVKMHDKHNRKKNSKLLIPSRVDNMFMNIICCTQLLIAPNASVCASTGVRADMRVQCAGEDGVADG